MDGVDVVVCTLWPERAGELRRCVAGVLVELRAADRLIVVTAPGSVDAVRATLPAGVVVLASTGGLSAARNTGVRAGDRPVVFFLDDDAVPRPGWRASGALFADPTLLGLGGVVHPDFGPRGRPWWFPLTQDWAVGCDHPGLPAPGGEIRNPIGAAMAVRRCALDALGPAPFDPARGRVGDNAAGGEETDLFLRLRELFPAGRVIRTAELTVDHRVPASRATPRYLLRRAYAEGRSKAAARDLSSEVGMLHRLPPLLRRELRSGSGLLRAGLVLAAVGAAGAGFLLGRRRPFAAPPPPGPGVPDLSVVVCTAGTRPLDATLDSLRALQGPETEIILVDNSPAQDLRPPANGRIRVIAAPVRGLSRARNAGARAARAEVVAFTDDDAVVDKHWARHLLAAFTDDKIWCATGRTLPARAAHGPERWFEMAGGFDKGPRGRDWHLDLADAPPFHPYPAGRIGSGNNMAFRRTALARIGGFAPELGAGTPTGGGEDLDAFRSVILAGGTVRYVPAALVTHRHRTSRRELRHQMFAYGTGMAASLGRCLLDDPAHARVILRAVPGGCRFLLRKRTRPAADGARLPADILLSEALGYLLGGPLLLYTLLRDARHRL